jgi:hypothetical protein
MNPDFLSHSNMNRPDAWVILEITNWSSVTYKLLAGWYGGYGGSDSWKLNSGIIDYTTEENTIAFKGYSGSEYVCSKDTERMTGLMGSVFQSFEKAISENGEAGHSMKQISFEEFSKKFQPA